MFHACSLSNCYLLTAQYPTLQFCSCSFLELFANSCLSPDVGVFAFLVHWIFSWDFCKQVCELSGVTQRIICVESIRCGEKDFIVSTFQFIISCKTSADNVQNLNCKLHQKSETTFEACKRHQLFSV